MFALAVFAVPAGPPLVSLMPMVLQALYWVVSPWWLSLTLRVAVAEVALSVVLLVMPVARPLQAILWVTASLMLLMLLLVRVCGSVFGRSVACVQGCAAFIPGRALAGSLGSDTEVVQ